MGITKTQKTMQIVAKYSNNGNHAQIGRVVNAKGQTRFVVLTEEGTKAVYSNLFVRKGTAHGALCSYLQGLSKNHLN